MQATDLQNPDSFRTDFQLQFRAETGDAFSGGVYQWITVLNARGGPSARVSMLLNRHNGDLIGRPVGLFSRPLTRDEARVLEVRLDALASTTLPAPTKGDVTATMLRLDYRHQQRTLSAQFNAMSFGFLNAIDPAMKELRAVMSDLLNRPERAMLVSLETTRDYRFGVRLTNIGTGDLMVADPRVLASAAPFARAYVKVAQEPVTTPGMMEVPPRWQRLPVEIAIGVQDLGVTLAPGSSVLALTFPWTSPAPGAYLAQAVWEDYGGPALLKPLTVQPDIPASADPDSRPFLLRGAAFSSYLRFKT